MFDDKWLLTNSYCNKLLLKTVIMGKCLTKVIRTTYLKKISITCLKCMDHQVSFNPF